MDIGRLAETVQRRIDDTDNRILSLQSSKTAQEAVRDRLQGLMSQSAYSIEDINFLIEVSNQF
jgi:hypothetical protein